jgi:short subunit dehydrogenase-like uncharacterized protein
MEPSEHPPMADFLLYGAYGYTGELVAEAAVKRDLDPLLAGRREQPLADLATSLGCEYEAFDLSHRTALTETLETVDVALNCAGPFIETYEPFVEACIDTGTHYLDITGEIDVFQAIAEYDEAATAADVMLLPGSGFDVVPTDCLAAHLAERLPDATDLTLGFQALGSMSGGTAKTTVEYLDQGAFVRRDGLLEQVPPAHRTRRIDFGRGETTAAIIPWGDVATAYHTTDIPNIEVYMALPEPVIWAMRASRPFSPVLGQPLVKHSLQSAIDTFLTGPSERTRERGRSYVWGEATNDTGDRVVSRLETVETYALTVETCLLILRRVLDGDAPVGYQTPAGAYGADLVLEVPDTEREDVE